MLIDIQSKVILKIRNGKRLFVLGMFLFITSAALGLFACDPDNELARAMLGDTLDCDRAATGYADCCKDTSVSDDYDAVCNQHFAAGIDDAALNRLVSDCKANEGVFAKGAVDVMAATLAGKDCTTLLASLETAWSETADGDEEFIEQTELPDTIENTDEELDPETEEEANVVSCMGEGSVCDDLNACTVNDHCVDSVCVGEAMDCSSFDEACGVGLCVDGECTYAPYADGASCTLSSVCRTNGVCRDGECIGEAVADGTPCDDFDPCTSEDACKDGECVGSGECPDGDIDETEEADEEMEIEEEASPTCTQDGQACNDDDPCTTGDACLEGECVGEPMDCSTLDSPCGVGRCVEGTCEHAPFVNDTPCTSGNSCLENESCLAGVCTNGEAVENGTVCDDGDPCTLTDTCVDGFCVGAGDACADGDEEEENMESFEQSETE